MQQQTSVAFDCGVIVHPVGESIKTKGAVCCCCTQINARLGGRVMRWLRYSQQSVVAVELTGVNRTRDDAAHAGQNGAPIYWRFGEGFI